MSLKNENPSSRSNSAFTSIGSKFYIYGGTGRGKVLDEFLVLDTGMLFFPPNLLPLKSP